MKINQTIGFIAIPLMLVLTVNACKNKTQMDNSKVLADTDRFYSEMSVKEGMNAAFLDMFDTSGVLLRANHMPIEGRETIRELLMSQNDSTFTLSWEPTFAKMAASGDLGYTYGTYKIIDKTTDSVSGAGTYATIWEKQKNGKWKAILDTGNPGLGK